jgi:hypothetical protein
VSLLKRIDGQTNPIFRASISGIVLAFTMLVPHQATAAETADKKVIHFPEEGLGTLYAARVLPNAPYSSWQYRRIGFARGNVTVDKTLALKVKLSTINMDSLPALKRLGTADLQALDFAYCHLSDSDWRYFTHFSGLVELRITDSQLSDGSLSNLRSFPRLRALCLTRCNLTSDGMHYIGGLPALETVVLCGNNITDDGIGKLRSLHKITTMDLAETSIDDDAAMLFRTWPLKSLELNNTKITDRSIFTISKMPLQYLGLHRCAITDKSIKWLGAMSHLRMLDVSDTALSQSALRNTRGSTL